MFSCKPYSFFLLIAHPDPNASSSSKLPIRLRKNDFIGVSTFDFAPCHLNENSLLKGRTFLVSTFIDDDL